MGTIERIIYLTDNEKRFRDFNETDKINLQAKVLELAYVLGFKDTTAKDAVLIADFLQQMYLDFRTTKLFDAFKLGISGKLGMETNEINHYNNFNIIYVSRFINAYNKYENEKLVQYRNR